MADGEFTELFFYWAWCAHANERLVTLNFFMYISAYLDLMKNLKKSLVFSYNQIDTECIYLSLTGECI